jgi:hypothetical protein
VFPVVGVITNHLKVTFTLAKTQWLQLINHLFYFPVVGVITDHLKAIFALAKTQRRNGYS